MASPGGPRTSAVSRRRAFLPFSWKGAHYRICAGFASEESAATGISAAGAESVCEEIKRLRKILEDYIENNPLFATSFSPLPLDDDAPEIARRMLTAAAVTGVGPMAAVAGAIAQSAAEYAIARGASEAIVENGGDIYLHSAEGITVGLYAGGRHFGGKLALFIPSSSLPLAVCSSSGVMGHSVSLGRCDLATVFSKNASLADAAATLAGNLVASEDDIAPALERIMSVEGVSGVLIMKNCKLGMAGEVPELVKNMETDLGAKISHDEGSDFRIA